MSTGIHVAFVTPSDAIAEGARPWDGGTTRLTPYVGPSHFGETREVSGGPQGYLVDFHPGPGGQIRPHAHPTHQFQVVVGGGGRLGRQTVRPGSFHYVDPLTTYGPIVPGGDGIAYFTLRARGTGTAYWMPEDREEVRGRRGRNLTSEVRVEGLPTGISPALERTDDGLAAYSIRLEPRGQLPCPPSAEAGGQFHLVIAGSLREGPREVPPRSLRFSPPSPDERPLTAGDDGAVVLVLQFPAL